MTIVEGFVEPRDPFLKRAMIYGLIAAFVAVVFWSFYRAFTDVGVVTVSAPPQIAIEMLPPPPPPKPMDEPQLEEKKPEPVESAIPSPTPSPAPPSPMVDSAPAAASMTMNADVQAGTSGIAAGSGAGMGAPGGGGTCIGPNCGRGGGGGGISDDFFGRYLQSELQQRMQSNGRINRLAFTAEFAIEVNGNGRVTSAALVRSTGDQARDALLRDALEAVRGLDAPPATMRWPQKITVRGRKGF
ncbi:MAG: TonB C-terminal domain-containing protein [Sphingomonadaceae bacterium]